MFSMFSRLHDGTQMIAQGMHRCLELPRSPWGEMPCSPSCDGARQRSVMKTADCLEVGQKLALRT